MLKLAEAPASLIAQRFAPHPSSANSEQRQSVSARIATLPGRLTKPGDKTMLSLSEAAKTAGIAKSTIWRAIKSGRISATRTHLGTYEVDPAELFRVFRAMPTNGAMKQTAMAIETGAMAALDVQISALKEVSSFLKEQVEDIRKDRDAWRTQAEANQRLLTDARPRRRGWFGWP